MPFKPIWGRLQPFASLHSDVVSTKGPKSLGFLWSQKPLMKLGHFPFYFFYFKKDRTKAFSLQNPLFRMLLLSSQILACWTLKKEKKKPRKLPWLWDKFEDEDLVPGPPLMNPFDGVFLRPRLRFFGNALSRFFR